MKTRTKTDLAIELFLYFCGMALIVAATLKIHGIIVGLLVSVDAFPFTSANSFLFIVATTEFVLGAMLAFGRRNFFITVTAATMFGLFAIIQLYNVLISADSCGCMGVVNVSPLIMFGLDLFASIALLAIAIYLRRCETKSSVSRRLAIFSSTGFLVLIPALLLVEASIDASGIRANPLVVDQPYMSNQTVTTERRKLINVRFINRSFDPIRIVGGEFM